MEKKKLPQVHSSGVSQDYLCQYFDIYLLWDKLPQKEKIERIKAHPIKRYTQEYPPDEYDDVITPDNIGKVSRLDEIADLVNSFEDASIEGELKLKKLVYEVRSLIYDKPS